MYSAHGSHNVVLLRETRNVNVFTGINPVRFRIVQLSVTYVLGRLCVRVRFASLCSAGCRRRKRDRALRALALQAPRLAQPCLAAERAGGHHIKGTRHVMTVSCPADGDA